MEFLAEGVTGIFALAITIAVCSFSQAGDPQEDEFIREGIMRPKYRPIPADVVGAQTTQLSLDGTWRINPAPPENWPKDKEEGEGWKDFGVPGQWLQQGFDIPRDNTAAVRKEFDVPESWKGNRVILRFDAIHAGTDYYVNGRHIGYSENLFTPVEWDITDAVAFGGKNHLALAMKVGTASEAQSLSCIYAFHNIGGIDRSVRLFVLPPVHISRLHYDTDMDAQYKDASLIIDISIANKTAQKSSDYSLKVRLNDANNKEVPLEKSNFDVGELEIGENVRNVTMTVKEPKKWNAEKPYLYKLSVELLNNDSLLERVEDSVGFRKIEILKKQLFLNGALVKLAGMGLHEVNPLSGRANTAKYAKEDVSIMKDANLNYTRTVHYPHCREFYDECDKQGLYVECEAPFCWAPGTEDPVNYKTFLLGTAAMLEYHRNHPSIIIWSLANESPFGKCLQKTLEYVKKNDPRRLVTNQEWAGERCSVSGWHYGPFPCDADPNIKDISRATLYGEYHPPMSVWFPEEYNVNPGIDMTWSEGQNSPDSYVSQFHHSPHVIGGAIWGLSDDQFVFPDRTVKGYGEWGFIDAWRRKKSMFWDLQLIHSPAWIPIRTIEFVLRQKTASIPVENRYSFTNLNELAGTWEFRESKKNFRIDVPPRTNGEIIIPLPESARAWDMITIKFFGAKGNLIAAHGVKLVPPSEESIKLKPVNLTKRTINLDGQFKDWDGIEDVNDGAQNEKQEGNDIERIRAAYDYKNLYLLIKCAAPIKKPSTWSPTFAVIDADNNPETGFQSKPLGIDYLIQPYSESEKNLMIHQRHKDANSAGWQGWLPP